MKKNERAVIVELNRFMDCYTPEIASLAKESFERLRRLVPGAHILIYDNYNALVVGFGPGDKASEAIMSIALYPRWISLFFLQGSGLTDPDGLLKGTGGQVRHLILRNSQTLEEPAVIALIDEALKRAKKTIDPSSDGIVEVRSISENQRPRRPVSGKK